MNLLESWYRAEGVSVSDLLDELRVHMPQRLASLPERLSAHLDWCRTRVPMYAETIPAGSDPWARLAAIEPFPKSRLSCRDAQTRAMGWPGRLREEHTSGTSGHTFRFVVSRGEIAARRAYELRANELLGLAPGQRHLVVWGGHESEGWRRRLRNHVFGGLARRELLVVSSSDPLRLTPVLSRLEAHRGGVLITYPSILHGLCEAGGAPALRALRAILLTGEAVEFEEFAPHGLDNLRNRYGTREFGALALGQGSLAYFGDRFVLEEDPDLGLLVTDLIKRAMPLLRYPVGDFAEDFRPNRPCEEPWGLPPLGRLRGRVMDRLRGRSGRLFVGTFWTLTMRKIGVEKFRVEETAPGRLRVPFVAPYDGAELLRRLSPFLEGEFEIEPVQRPDIPEQVNIKQKVVTARAD